MEADAFRKMVERAKEYILAGDIIQVVNDDFFAHAKISRVVGNIAAPARSSENKAI